MVRAITTSQDLQQNFGSLDGMCELRKLTRRTERVFSTWPVSSPQYEENFGRNHDASDRSGSTAPWKTRAGLLGPH
jgi:hypothetical protein